MKQIFILRHAKSSWNFPLKDFDRPLNDIGIDKANKISLITKDLLPNDFSIWSSSAKRAKSTCEIFIKNWNIDHNQVEFKDNLYTFDGNELEKIVKSCLDNVNNLILFGHNHAITDFVNKFGDIFIDNVPTSGLVSIIFESDNWATIKNGKIDNIIFPRDL